MPFRRSCRCAATRLRRTEPARCLPLGLVDGHRAALTAAELCPRLRCCSAWDAVDAGRASVGSERRQQHIGVHVGCELSPEIMASEPSAPFRLSKCVLSSAEQTACCCRTPSSERHRPPSFPKTRQRRTAVRRVGLPCDGVLRRARHCAGEAQPFCVLVVLRRLQPPLSPQRIEVFRPGKQQRVCHAQRGCCGQRPPATGCSPPPRSCRPLSMVRRIDLRAPLPP